MSDAAVLVVSAFVAGAWVAVLICWRQEKRIVGILYDRIGRETALCDQLHEALGIQQPKQAKFEQPPTYEPPTPDPDPLQGGPHGMTDYIPTPEGMDGQA